MNNTTILKKVKQAIFILPLVLLVACGGSGNETKKSFAPPAKKEPVSFEDAVKDWQNNKGIGPVATVNLGQLDKNIADQGKEVFTAKCSACHEIGKVKVGPDLTGVTERRTPEWIMNMVLNPSEMTKNDPIAHGLLAKYMTEMANQQLTRDQARQVLEFFRTLGSTKEASL